MWKQWINALLGVALVVVPFLGLTGDTLTWTLVVMGVVVAALSIWTTSEVSSDEYARLTHSHA